MPAQGRGANLDTSRRVGPAKGSPPPAPARASAPAPASAPARSSAPAPSVRQQAASKAVPSYKPSDSRSAGGGGSHAPYTPPPLSLAYHANPVEKGVTGKELRFQQNVQFGPGAFKPYPRTPSAINMRDFRVGDNPGEKGKEWKSAEGKTYSGVYTGGAKPKPIEPENPNSRQGTAKTPKYRRGETPA